MWTARYSQILHRVGYDQDEEFKKLKAIQSLRQNDTSKSSGYTLPKAFFQRCPISKAKLEDLLQLCEDLTIPSSLHQFHNQLKSQNQRKWMTNLLKVKRKKSDTIIILLWESISWETAIKSVYNVFKYSRFNNSHYCSSLLFNLLCLLLCQRGK